MEIKKVALTIGIAVLFTLFIVFLVDAFYTQPEYSKYCTMPYYSEPVKIAAPQNCTDINNQSSIDNCYKNQGEIRYKYDSNGCAKEVYCDPCSKEFNAANAKYNKNIFYISAIIGIIAIIAGLYLPKTLDAISSGFMFGGILIITQGTFRVFGDLNKVSRVIVLGIELIILVWIGYKKVKERK